MLHFLSTPPLLSVAVVLHLLIRGAHSAYAQGNLQLVFNPKTGRSTDAHPITANLTNLWCQAADVGVDGELIRRSIAKARFLHFNPDKAFAARVEDNRAYLDLGQQNLFASGKYKCEITTHEGEFVHGNLYVYMRPVFHTNSSLRLEQKDEKNPFEFTGSSAKAVRGTTAVLHCPARGYPLPEIRWFKDDIILGGSDKYKLVRNELHIREVDDDDEGTYRCVASNEFPAVLDGQKQPFDAFLDQQLRVSDSLAWLVPLIVIIITLLLLFIVIYTCAWWKRRAGHKSYNVALQEKSINGAERLHDEDD